MSLINYVEPASSAVGPFLMGLSFLLFVGVFSWIMYRFYKKGIQYFDLLYNHEAKYKILEESFLDKIAESKGIDLNKELVRKKMIEETKPKTFRKKLEEQIYEEMFGKEKSSKE